MSLLLVRSPTRRLIPDAGLSLCGNDSLVTLTSEIIFKNCYSTAGLRVVDVSNPTSPVEVGFYSMSGCAYGVAVAGNYAYVADGDAGMHMMDISNPTSPSPLGFFNTFGWAYGVAVVGNFAYVVESGCKLHIVDISHPTSLIQVGYCNTSDIARGVAVVGNYAFVAASYAGLRVVDISNPASPYEVGSFNTPGHAYGVAVSGWYAYVADYEAGVRVVDVQNPFNPLEIGFYDTPGNAYSVAVSGSYAYVADGDLGLRVVDVGIPSNPVEVGYYLTPSAASCVVVQGDYAYLTDFLAGLRIVDISNSASPYEVGFYNSPGEAHGLVVAGNYAYLADYDYFGIYQFSPPNVTIALTPINPPITLPASGGSFNFNVSVANNGASAQTTDAWIMTQLPSGSWYGPLLGPINLTLPGSVTLTRLRTQTIPAVAPAGVYWYEGRVGDYPSTITDTSGFSFTKLGSGSQDSYEIQESGVGEWTNTGEEFVGGTRSVASNGPEGDMTEHVPPSISPNPFNPSTVASYELRVPSHVSLRVYDTAGRLVETLVNGWREAGQHEAMFDGSSLPSGVYLYRLEAGEYSLSGKMVLLK